MKTFEEALARVIVAENNPVPQVSEATMATVTETGQRYRELVNEARDNPTVQAFVTMRMMMVAQEQEHPRAVLTSMFCCGLICGVEMEKEDPEVQL